MAMMMMMVTTAAKETTTSMTAVVIVNHDNIATMVISTVMVDVSTASNICSRRSIVEADDEEHSNQYQNDNRETAEQ